MHHQRQVFVIKLAAEIDIGHVAFQFDVFALLIGFNLQVYISQRQFSEVCGSGGDDTFKVVHLIPLNVGDEGGGQRVGEDVKVEIAES